MPNNISATIISTPFQLLLAGLLVWGAVDSEALRLWTSGGGVVFFFLAAYLLAMSGIRGFGRYFLALAYIAFLVGLLNYLAVSAAAAPFGLGRPSMAATLGFLYFLFQAALVFLPTAAKNQFPLNENEKNLVYRGGIATSMALMVGGCIVGWIVSAASGKWFDMGLPPTWNAYYFCLLFAALFSGAEGVFLMLGPRVLRGSPVTFRGKETTVAAAVLLIIYLAEFELRRNWVLLGFSAIAFAGTALAFFLVWHKRGDSQEHVLQRAQQSGRQPDRV